RLTGEYGFRVLNASRSVRTVAADLRRAIVNVLEEPAPPAGENVSHIQPLRNKAAPAKPATNLLDLNKKALP
ncbi:MAG TPA: hypothetical protein VFO72_05615, partial [Pyrinomonadaceae bacterium]|nr:hypothetical protein [Pyrinomonadaceae bacterium]